jgi:thiol:disulfide interchange protein DsbD
LVAGGATLTCAQTARQQHAKLSLISEHTSVPAGGSEWVGLRFQLEPGWHIYWSNPGDSGEPPNVTWQMSSGAQTGPLQFPAPERIKDHSLIDYGYLNDVVLLSQLRLAQKIDSKTLNLAAEVKYLVCREVCIPGKDHLSLVLDVNTRSKKSSEAGVIERSKTLMPQPLPPGVKISAVSYSDTIAVSVYSKRQDFGLIKDLFPEDTQVLDNSSGADVTMGKDMEQLKLKKSDQLNRPIHVLRALLVTSNKAYDVTIPVHSDSAQTGVSAHKE